MEKAYQTETSNKKNKSVIKSRYEPTKLQVKCKNETNVVPIGKEEEWSTSKKIVNHKTKQVETRVQRQIIMEDGKVIADSGPQITTRTKEDHKTEESENSNKKSKADKNGYSQSFEPGDEVISEKIETHNTTREAKQENLQYHDESIKELTGYDIHKKAIAAPNELLTIDDNQIDSPKPCGKLTHYSSKSQKVTDKEEIKEVSRVNRNGKVTSEVTRTHQHEEVDDDEIPEDQAGLDTLPEASAETTRKIEFHKNYDDDERESQLNEQKLAVEGNDNTNKWVENHFGSETGSSYESKSKTKAGGNRINIELSSSQRPSNRYKKDLSMDKERKLQKEEIYRSNYIKKESSRQSPVNGMANRYTNDRSSSPTKWYQSYSRHEVDSFHRKERENVKDEKSKKYESEYVQRSKRKVCKEDASVQASLSDESSEEEQEDKKEFSKSKSQEYRGYQESNESRPYQNNVPIKTFYFGENESNNSKHQRQEVTFLKTPEKRYTTHLTIEKDKSGNIFNYSDDDDFNFDNQDIDDNQGELKATFKHELKSLVNDEVIKDSSMNETFYQSYHTAGDKLEAQRSFNRLMDKSFPEPFQSKDFSSKWKKETLNQDPMTRERESIHLPIFLEDHKMYSSKDAEKSRRSNASQNFSKRDTSPVPELIKVESKDRYSYRPSYSSTYQENHRSGTLAKSKRKDFPFQTEKNREWPEFSPLLSPIEIKNVSNLENAHRLMQNNRKNYYSSSQS